jgi:hypothetical protein
MNALEQNPPLAMAAGRPRPRNLIEPVAAPRHTPATAAAVNPANSSDRAAWLTATTPG